MQSPSAPWVLFLAPPLGTLCSVQWLPESDQLSTEGDTETKGGAEPAFPFDWWDSGLIILKWVGCPIPQLGTMLIHWMWSLQVLSPFCWVFLLMFSLLGSGHLLGPWHLGLSSTYTQISIPTATQLFSNSWPSVLLPHILPYLNCPPFPSLFSLTPRSLSPSTSQRLFSSHYWVGL